MWNVTGVRHRSCHLHFSLAGGACRCRLAAANLWVSDSIHMMSHTRAFPWWPGHRTRAVALGSPAPSLDAPATGRSPPDGHKESTDERGEKKLSVWSNETLWMWLNCRVMDKPKHWTNWKLWPDDATRWKVIGSQKNITKVRDCAQEKAWKPIQQFLSSSTICWWCWRKSPDQKVHPLVNVNPIQSLLSSVLNLVSVKNYPNYRCSLLTLDCATTFSGTL